MRKSVYFLFFLLFACNHSEQDNKKSSSGEVNTKDSTEDSLSNTSTENSDSLIESFTFIVQFNINWTSSYCGGAPPSEEMMEDLRKPRAYKNSSIKLWHEESQLFYLIHTDENGFSKFILPSGHYWVYLSDEFLDKDLDGLFNPKCKLVMNKVWKKFELKEGQTGTIHSENVSISFNFECDPCDPTIKMRP